MVAAMLATQHQVQLSTPVGARVALDWGQRACHAGRCPFTRPLIYASMLDVLCARR